MAISKIGSKALVDCSVAAVDIADNSITAAKLAGSIANAKLANSSVTINSTSVSLGGSANINALDWQSVIVADGSTGTTGVAGRGYFINTTSAAHTFTLPVSATRGDTIAIKDYAGTFATFNLTIGRNGHKIQGVENNSLISTNRASVVLVYVDVTRGWEFTTESNVADLQEVLFISATGGTVTESGNYKIHTFTGDGSFVVSTVGNPAGSDSVDYLVVAGGGSGSSNTASNNAGTGGGAGGFRESVPSPAAWIASPLANPGGALPVSATTYPITIGAGGTVTPGSPQNQNGTPGSPSIFSSITSTGGGGGGSELQVGLNGGSGGGAGSGCNGTPLTPNLAGSGNTPPTSPSQGNPGGRAAGSGNFGAGGGGGAGGPGGNGTPTAGGQGGAGATSSINGTPTARGGGGGGGTYAGGTPASGGSGGGGNAGPGPNGNGLAGSTNTGGGGGGSAVGPSNNADGGTGGSGIVIIRYKFQ
jgi:hypothetical protein